MAVNVSWEVRPYSLVDYYQRLEGNYCLQLPIVKMEAARSSETQVPFYHTARRHIPEDGNI
jgi:hypothetical protein